MLGIIFAMKEQAASFIERWNEVVFKDLKTGDVKTDRNGGENVKPDNRVNGILRDAT